MRRRTSVGAAVLMAAVLLAVPAATAGSKTKPYVLTALADVGTVYWRYDCVHARTPRWSLGIRVWRTTATTGVVFRTGKLTVRRTLQPGGPTGWFPFRADPLQSLTASQMTEPRTLHALVMVDFRHAGCFVYEPPRFSAKLYTNPH
jgi:hypothetical protein